MSNKKNKTICYECLKKKEEILKKQTEQIRSKGNDVFFYTRSKNKCKILKNKTRINDKQQLFKNLIPQKKKYSILVENSLRSDNKIRADTRSKTSVTKRRNKSNEPNSFNNSKTNEAQKSYLSSFLTKREVLPVLQPVLKPFIRFKQKNRQNISYSKKRRGFLFKNEKLSKTIDH